MYLKKKRDFRLRLIQSILFVLIMTIFFTIGQNLDFVPQENVKYENLIYVYLGWWVGELLLYLFAEEDSSEDRGDDD